AVALLGAAPWILSAGAALGALVRQRAWRDPRETAWVALALWAVGGIALAALSPFRLPHYGLPAYFAVALLAARGWEFHGGRRLVVAHALVFAALALVCGLFWVSDGSHFLESVLGATDVATPKSAAAGQGAPLPSFAEFQPLLGDAALVFAAGAVTSIACVLVGGGAWAPPRGACRCGAARCAARLGRRRAVALGQRAALVTVSGSAAAPPDPPHRLRAAAWPANRLRGQSPRSRGGYADALAGGFSRSSV